MGVLTALAVGAASCATTGAPFVTPTTSDGPFIAGYHPYWAADSWTEYPFDLLTQLYFFEIEVAGDGSLTELHGWPGRWTPLVERALDAGVQVTPTISMHDPEAFGTLFADTDAVARLVDQIVSLVRGTPGLAGVHLDFEVFQPVDLAARDGYTAFAAELAGRLKDIDPRLSLSIFTLAFDDDDVYNERALAAVADYVVVQGYDYHSIGEATAGPLAALEGWGRLNWTSVVERFLAFGVPARKIVMALPMYGYQWPTESDEPGSATRGEAVAIPLTAPPDVVPELPRAHAQARLHGVRRDPESGSPYYVFRDAEGWHQGWFEDAESLKAKFEFVRAQRLGGLALFPLAYADAAARSELRRFLVRPRS